MIYILDTDHVSLFQRRHPRVCQRIGKTSPRDLAVTIVTAEEQLRGWLSQIRRASSRGGRLVTAYARLQAAIGFFGSVRLLELDDQANARYEELRDRKLRIGTLDLRIASIALATGGTLVSRNRVDFDKVPDLVIEDWSRG